MRWYNGGIAEAISASKSKGAIFVVYIEGHDEKSQEITNLINTDELSSKLSSDHFVAIKIDANSLPHQQFGEIYNNTAIPSLYFIGKNGVPLEIITEANDSQTLLKKIDEILVKGGVSLSAQSSHVSVSQNLINSEQISMPANVVCENGVCTLKKEEPASSSTVPEGEDVSLLSPEEKVERAKQLLELKREEKEKKEKENERQKEIERRQMGKNVQQMKKWQEDQELKQLKEDREKEKRENQEARDRVLAQIAQDKAERASKFSPPSPQPQRKEPAPSTPSTSKSTSNIARLQFKMPDGSSKTHDFPSYDKLESVVNYIKANLNVPFSNFTLSTTFPRRQFTENDHSQSLADLELTPNAVILILPLNQGTVSAGASGAIGGLSTFIWSLLTPFLQLFGMLRSFIFGGTANSAGDANRGQGAQSSSGSSRSNSVVHIRSKYDFENRLKNAGTSLVVVDFFATWCGPCRMIAPQLEQLARDYYNVVFLKVDVDENGDISRDYRVSSMPTFVFLKSRRELTRFSGADYYQLKNTIDRYR